jgi:acyl dehydratase
MDKVRFSAPTFLGDTIHLELEITRSRETSDGGIVVVDQKSQEPGRRRRLLGNSQAADGKPARRGDWLTS